MTCVLDASALLAFLQDEPGGEVIEPLLSQCLLSSVNWAEVVQKSLSRHVDIRGLREDVEALGVSITPFTPGQAEIAGALWKETRRFGLSLGDRSCLALGLHLRNTVFTTDRVWKNLPLDLDIRLIR